MPLNKRGESLGDLGKGRVADNARWRDTAFFDEAAGYARDVFQEAGAFLPVSFEDSEVLIQEYEKDSKLAFIFCKKVNGSEMFYPFVFNLNRQLITELRGVNRWGYLH